MIFEVSEFDNDYNAFCGYVYIKAHTKSDAEQWCRDNTWSGHTYIFSTQVNHPVQHILQDLTIDDTDFAC